MKRVLVTGASGFLGGYLLSGLRERYSVTGLGRTDGPQGSSWLRCDLTDEVATKRVLASLRPDVVVHCAAMSKLGVCETHPSECQAANVTALQNLAEAALGSGVRSLIHMSSDRIFQEDSNVYGASKARAERLLVTLAERGGPTAFVSLRLGKVAGSPGGFLEHWNRSFRQHGVIESTGPDQSSFFLSRAELLAHVQHLVEHAHECSGQVHVPDHKAACMRAILDLWTEVMGGSWKDTSDGTGAAESTRLISADERGRATHQRAGELGFHLIPPPDANCGGSAPAGEALTTANAPALTRDDMLAMLAEAGVRPLESEEEPRG